MPFVRCIGVLSRVELDGTGAGWADDYLNVGGRGVGAGVGGGAAVLAAEDVGAAGAPEGQEVELVALGVGAVRSN